MIKLNDFIAETLAEIVEGVVQAQARVQPHGAAVSPAGERRLSSMQIVPAARLEQVEFDIEVTTSTEANKKTGLGVFVAPIQAGTLGQTGSQERSVGRIRFKVFLQLPTPKAPAEGKRG